MAEDDREAGYLFHILEFLQNNNDNKTSDLTRPTIRHTLRYVYPLFILLYGIVILFATCGNLATIVIIVKNRLYRNPTFFLLGNLAFSDIIKSMVVLPITLSNLLIHPWLFGSFLCFFLPMMQYFPIHASMLTFLLIAVDRYRHIVHPMQSRMPAGLCIIAVWVIAVCVVLPFAVYIKYFDLTHLGPEFKGVGLCMVNIERKIEEYIRAIFVTLYCLPLAIIAFMYVKVSGEFKARIPASIAIQFSTEGEEHIPNFSEATYHSRITLSTTSESDPRVEPEGDNGGGLTRVKQFYSSRVQADYDDDLNIEKEKRTQKYLITMVTLFAMCWCPINILIVVTHFVYENTDNTGHFDITYLTFTFFGFLSTCINPILFASWRMSSTTKDRLKGYFRFSNRRRSCTSSSRGSANQPPEVFTHKTLSLSSASNSANGRVESMNLE